MFGLREIWVRYVKETSCSEMTGELDTDGKLTFAIKEYGSADEQHSK